MVLRIFHVRVDLSRLHLDSPGDSRLPLGETSFIAYGSAGRTSGPLQTAICAFSDMIQVARVAGRRDRQSRMHQPRIRGLSD